MKPFPIRELISCVAIFAGVLLPMGLSSCAAAAPGDKAVNALPAVRAEKDVIFLETKNPKTGETLPVKLDVYHATSEWSGKRPAVVLVHGGGWAAGDKAFYKRMGEHLARKGYVAFSINYRLAPLFRYPAQVDDAQRAVRWIRAHAAEYNVDPERIGAVGDSAGGYLVAMLGMRATRDNSEMSLANYSSKVQCVVNVYGPTDFTLDPKTPMLSSLGRTLLVQFLGKEPGSDSVLYKEASPISYVTKDAAPMLLIHGTIDPLVPDDQARRLHDALKTAGVDATLVLFQKYGHGFLDRTSGDLTDALIETFLARHLKP